MNSKKKKSVIITDIKQINMNIKENFWCLCIGIFKTRYENMHEKIDNILLNLIIREYENFLKLGKDKCIY